MIGILICDRKDVIKRFNIYGSQQHKDPSSWRRLDTHPLVLGDAVCSRLDCIYIYACESTYTDTRQRYRSSRSNDGFLSSGSTTAPTKPSHLHDRYRTSKIAVQILIEALKTNNKIRIQHLAWWYTVTLMAVLHVLLAYNVELDQVF